DLSVRDRRRWAWQVVDYDRASARRKQLSSGVRFRGAQGAALAAGPARVPLAIAIRGYSRMHDELVSAIASEPADFVYGGRREHWRQSPAARIGSACGSASTWR